MEEVKTIQCKNHSKSKSVLFALVLLGVGTALLLRNLGYMDEYTQSIIFSWPMLVVAIGITNLGRPSFFFGLFLIFFGGFFVLANIYDIPVRFGQVFWPSVLILIGLGVLYAGFKVWRRKKWVISNSSENVIDEVAVFGGGVKSVISNAFRGGNMVNVFGGSKLDFSNSEMAEGTHELNFVSIFGGSSMIVPANWHVKIEVVSIFGNFVDKRQKNEVDLSKTIIIKGVAIFGGGELKSF